jgi:hypothetical protein
MGGMNHTTTQRDASQPIEKSLFRHGRTAKAGIIN